PDALTSGLSNQEDGLAGKDEKIATLTIYKAIKLLTRRSLVEQILVLSVAFLFQVVLRDKPKRRRVDAVTKPAFVARTVIEHMAKVGIAEFASHLRTNHA